MVRRESFINKLNELSYYHKATQKRTYLYRKVGGTHYVSVPMRDMLSDEYAITTLSQCGCSEAQIKAFLASVKC
jgi:hypothetical protein